MLVVRLFFVFLFSANVVFAGDDLQFVISNPQTIKLNEISEQITIGSSVKLSQTACLKLDTTSNSGEFSSSNTNWSPVSILTMSKSSANRNFYYKDSIDGNYTLTVKISLKPETETRSCANWPTKEWNIQWTVSQNIVVASSNSTTVAEPTQSEPTTVVDSPNWPVEPQIFANAGADKTAVAGADIVFTGKALGLEKEPLDGARFLWSFGDGAIAEGKSVRHVYKYPGEYIVVLDVSSGKYSASDRSTAKIISNQLKIIEANQNYIKLHNGSNVELDISFWFLMAENSLFKFPANTFIKTNKDLMIDSSISGLSAAGGKAELLYPNGSTAFLYAKTTTNSTTVVESVSKIEPKTDFGYQQKADEKENQMANVISSAQEDGKKSNTGRWLAMASSVGVISAAGLIFVRRKGLL